MNHVMVDLETMGLHNRAPIMSIGACEFDRATIKRMFYRKVTLQSNIDLGRIPSASTIEWWLRQPREAIDALLGGDSCSLTQAMIYFSQFLVDTGVDGGFRLWANGPLQDIQWLETAFSDVGLEVPWSYTTPACFRTLRDSFPRVEIPDEGVEHNALDDAKRQARYLQELNSKFKLNIL